jgi:hypothetical protein
MNPTNATPLPNFILSLCLAAVLGYALSEVYVRFGKALSNRNLFARNFVLLAVTTTLVISIVKSSLALSLGLVGALSIVRFRAAIKEPEELVFLFLAISIGLGMGAGQILITVVALVVVIGLVALRHLRQRTPDQPNLFLTIATNAPRKISASEILALLTSAGVPATLKRLDESPERLETSFLVDFKEVGKLEEFRRKLMELNEGATLSCLDDRGLSA